MIELHEAVVIAGQMDAAVAGTRIARAVANGSPMPLRPDPDPYVGGLVLTPLPAQSAVDRQRQVATFIHSEQT